jgi:hypothetical protein
MNYTELYPEDGNIHEECCENLKSYIEACGVSFD